MSLFSIFWIAILIATNSTPSNIHPLLLTGCFSMTGSVDPGINKYAPAPQDPGFPRQEPSVKRTAASVSHFSTRQSISSLDNFSCSAVLDFDEPKVCQNWSDTRLHPKFGLCSESKSLCKCNLYESSDHGLLLSLDTALGHFFFFLGLVVDLFPRQLRGKGRGSLSPVYNACSIIKTTLCIS